MMHEIRPGGRGRQAADSGTEGDRLGELGWCVLVVYFEGHRAEPLTGLLQREVTVPRESVNV